MSEHFCIKLSKNSYSCVILNSNFTDITYKSAIEFNTFDELSNFLESKDNINISIYQENIIESSIEIQKNIKDNSVIEELIKEKLSLESIDTSKLFILFNRYKKNENNTLSYMVHGIHTDETTYLKSLDLLSNKNTGGVSLDIFSLYSVSKYIYSNRVFISVYISDDRLIIVAGDQKNIFYTRSKYYTFIDETNKQMEIIDEVIKNVLYIKEQIREVKFDLLTINGLLYKNSEEFKGISNQTKMETISVEAEKKRFSKLSPEIFNKHLIEIGSLHIDRKFDFTPVCIKSKKEFNKALNIYIPIFLILISYFAYTSYNNYNNYKSSKTKYQDLSNQILNKIQEIGLDKKSISKIDTFINSTAHLNKNNILEYMKYIKSSTEKIKNYNLGLELKLDIENFNWSDSKTNIKLIGTRRFKNLLDLNLFVNNFNNITKKLDKSIKVQIEQSPKSLTIKSVFIFTRKRK